MADFQMPYCPKVDGSLEIQSIDTIYGTPVSDGQLRLLHLEGFDDSGVLQCRFQPYDLVGVQTPAYIAASYTWNPEERVWYGVYDTAPKPVMINGQVTQISDKVANIMSLMYQTARKCIWIDAICVNQGDGNEKSTQVAQMGAIYRNAAEVVSILGSPSTKTDEAMTPDHWFSRQYQHRHSDALTLGLYDLFAFNRYWRRAWILQEITLAKQSTLCCGARMVDFQVAKEFLPISEVMTSTSETLSQLVGLGQGVSWSEAREGYQYLKKVMVGAYQEGDNFDPFNISTIQRFRGQTILELLKDSRRFNQCQDARDILYSRIALATDAAELVPPPDYSVPPKQVFETFATNCITKTSSLELLTCTTKVEDSEHKLPSWVPDWTVSYPYDEGSIWHPLKMRATNRAAMATLTWNHDSPSHVRRHQESLELSVSGRVLHVVPSRPKMSMSSGIFKAASAKMKDAWRDYTEDWDALQPGDLVCVMPECSHFICLRPVEEHYVLTCVHPSEHKRLIQSVLSEHVWSYELREEGKKREACWKFRDPAAISRVEVKTFTIR